MSLPSNGITQDVIREMMPPYHLDHDLLAGMVTALPPPPPDASATWRQARIARLVQEIAIFMPADAGQARIAVQIVVVREAADDTFARSHAAELTVEQVCRLRRTAADLTRTAATLERTLTRRQQKPAPFFGTVLAEGVDIAALDTVWCNGTLASAGAGSPASAVAGPIQQPATPEPAAGRPCPRALVPGDDPVGLRPDGEEVPDATPASMGETAPAGGVGPEPTADRPDAALPAAGAEPSPTVTPMPVLSGPTSGSVVTRLGQGPGWTLEVVRPATSGQVGIGATPGSAA
jgi:hypothetical protein